jgi:hypothetical protein
VRALSVLAVAGAAFGALAAELTRWAMCDSESGGSTMCPMGEPTTTMTAQVVVGVTGILPAAAMAYLAFTGRRTGAKVALAAGLVWWAGWAFLNDASVHGWGSGMTLL